MLRRLGIQKLSPDEFDEGEDEFDESEDEFDRDEDED